MLQAIGLGLLAVGGIGSLICWIMVLIKMFQNEKPLIGILGILCSLWAFVWGWMKSSTLGLKKTMLIWSGCIVLTIIGQVVAGAAMATQMQEQNGQYEISTPIETALPETE
jgi:hypothetical protein